MLITVGIRKLATIARPAIRSTRDPRMERLDKLIRARGQVVRSYGS